MRPLGGLVIGYIGDTYGRRKALIFSISLMLIPMIMLTFMPTYKMVGASAILLLILARMIQGFSIGGEYTGVLVMLSESSKPHLRGFTTSLASLTSSLGVLLSSFTIAILSTLLSKQQMLQFGWRIAFFIGLILGIIAIWMQMQVHESPIFKAQILKSKTQPHQKLKYPVLTSLKKYWRAHIYVFMLTGYIGIAYYLLITYLPNTLIIKNILPTHDIFWIGVAISATYAITSLFFGYLSDQVGRKLVILIPIAIITAGSFYYFQCLYTGSFPTILSITLLLAILISAMTAAFQVTINELFPTNCRFSGMSISYNVSNALFAGTAPMIASLLAEHYHSTYAPAWYLLISGFICFCIIITMPETRFSQYFATQT